LIAMTATAASDPSGVQYSFLCVAGACRSSGWQAGRTYTDTGLTAGAAYSYQVSEANMNGIRRRSSRPWTRQRDIRPILRR
jgi:hypothetical protein